jgi:PAS domain S-box-containing protein
MHEHALVVVDRSGTIQLWSAGAERLFGWSRMEAVGQTLDLIVPEDYREQHWAGFRRAMTAGSAKTESQSFDLPINCRIGAAVAPATFTLVRDGKKDVIGAMAILNVAQTKPAAA